MTRKNIYRSLSMLCMLTVAAMVFARDAVECNWKWGQVSLPNASMNVRVLVMYCWNVRHIVALELTLYCSCRQALEVVIHALKLGVVLRNIRSS